MCRRRIRVSPRAPIRADHGPSLRLPDIHWATVSLAVNLPSVSSHQERENAETSKCHMLGILIGSALPSWTSDSAERKSRV